MELLIPVLIQMLIPVSKINPCQYNVLHAILYSIYKVHSKTTEMQYMRQDIFISSSYVHNNVVTTVMNSCYESV